MLLENLSIPRLIHWREAGSGSADTCLDHLWIPWNLVLLDEILHLTGARVTHSHILVYEKLLLNGWRGRERLAPALIMNEDTTRGGTEAVRIDWR